MPSRLKCEISFTSVHLWFRSHVRGCWLHCVIATTVFCVCLFVGYFSYHTLACFLRNSSFQVVTLHAPNYCLFLVVFWEMWLFFKHASTKFCFALDFPEMFCKDADFGKSSTIEWLKDSCVLLWGWVPAEHLLLELAVHGPAHHTLHSAAVVFSHIDWQTFKCASNLLLGSEVYWRRCESQKLAKVFSHVLDMFCCVFVASTIHLQLVVGTGCPERVQIPHLQKHSGPGWMGSWTAWASGWQPYPWQGHCS